MASSAEGSAAKMVVCGILRPSKLHAVGIARTYSTMSSGGPMVLSLEIGISSDILCIVSYQYG